MKFAVVFAAAVAIAAATVTQQMVAEINSVQKDWTASLTTPVTGRMVDLLGVPELKAIRAGKLGAILPTKKYTAQEHLAAPASFDPRQEWPNCPTLNEVRDQSDCGSCWAFGAVEFMSDRTCIHTGEVVSLSAEDMNSCSHAGDCDGGYPSSAVAFWKSTGIVSDDCRPYSLPSCDHHIPGSLNPCNQSYPTPKCQKSCLPQSTKTYATDKHKAQSTYTVRGEADMMTELSKNGPCETAITVYEDFEAYTKGIYHHVSGSSLGGHAIKIMGYGEENGVKYWLLANSWNAHWGENGFFRMRRGNDECGVESEVYCGIPASKQINI